MARDAGALVKEAATSNPRRKCYEISLEGIRVAAKSIGEIAQPIIEVVAKLTSILI